MTANPDRLTALLGPTNTGKTFMAMERMLGHRSGMIGFPLRLLARENYDRAVKAVGAEACALVTGEEKIVPKNARYFLCTVESMPLDRPVAFLGVDEIQLAADPERGHIFTDRLLRARGREETMFMGAETMAPWVRALVPGIKIVARPRFSILSFAGAKKITRLPRRSAIVAFSAADVYAIADLVRRQRGGAAIVMGALSPRTRNAQVELYQAGEVDYLVATDAIGMGLNMDVRHVAFAALRKFDGNVARQLTRAEIGQIAGRAGRHMRDGTFGTTAEAGSLDAETIDAIENHRFPALPSLMWRNAALDFRSIETLQRSLEVRTPLTGLVRQQDAIDHQSLLALARDGEIRVLATGRARIALLWEVCQIPDFRKLMTDAHVRLLGQVYRFLAAGKKLPADWIAGQLRRLDRIDGDIDQLTQRIAHVRTWAYVAHRGEWIADPGHWQARAREIEDRLSEALHEALTQRFIDRRHAALSRHMASGTALVGHVAEDGAVLVEGHEVGRLSGLGFQPALDGRAEDARALLTAARRVLAPAIAARVASLASCPADALRLCPNGMIGWQGADLARLVRGDQPLRPNVELLQTDLVDGRQRLAIEQRLRHWLDAYLRRRLRPLFGAMQATLDPAARGLVYQLIENLGAMPRREAKAQLDVLSQADRRLLDRLGIRLGASTIWISGLEDKRQRRLLGQLSALWHRLKVDGSGRPDPATLEAAALKAWQFATGRIVIAGRAFSFAAVEQTSGQLRKKLAAGPLDGDAAASLHLTKDELAALLAYLRLGAPRRAPDGKEPARSGRKRSGKRPRAGEKARRIDPNSPFAVLASLHDRPLERGKPKPGSRQ